MYYKSISLLIVLATMALIVYSDLPGLSETDSPTLLIGFLLLSAYCTGSLLEKFKLPRITGYIFAGLFFGPFFLKFYSSNAVANLSFLNSLALAFIAFCAGGELQLNKIRSNIKNIFFLLVGGTSVVFIGVSLTLFAFSGFIPFLMKYDLYARFAVSAIFGVIAVARSPSSAIAIISETKAKGKYTETVLSVTVVTDVVIIILFAVLISICQATISSGSSIDPAFLLDLIFEIIVAFIAGFLLGKALVFLIERVKVEFPIVIIAMGFVVIKFCHSLGAYFHEAHDISLNIEPLLICMVAGFTVQNYSKHGNLFLSRMDRVSMPIYVGFFAITGASINIDALKTGWMLGLIIFLSRMLMLYIGSCLSGRLSGDDPIIYKNTWLGFITQAGVSLGLLSEVVRRFPEIGIPIQSILIASITLNQIIGPVAFKYALNKLGETNRAGR